MEYFRISSSAVLEICAQAKRGYETVQKQEEYGFLFGALPADGHLHIKTAVPYRGGIRSRTMVDLDGATTKRRWRQLQRQLRSTFFGSYHTHVEIAGGVSARLSEIDVQQFRSDSDARIELLAVVWASNHRGLPPPLSKTLAGFDPASGYQYRLKAYVKSDGRVKPVVLQVGA